MKTVFVTLGMLAAVSCAMAQTSSSYPKQKSADERFTEQAMADRKRMDKEESDARLKKYNEQNGASQRTGVTGSINPSKKEVGIGYQKSTR